LPFKRHCFDRCLLKQRQMDFLGYASRIIQLVIQIKQAFDASTYTMLTDRQAGQEQSDDGGAFQNEIVIREKQQDRLACCNGVTAAEPKQRFASPPAAHSKILLLPIPAFSSSFLRLRTLPHKLLPMPSWGQHSTECQSETFLRGLATRLRWALSGT
jgi:hypothetical protein